MKVVYGTGNQAKLAFMKRSLVSLPIELIGLKEAAKEQGILLPEVEEDGDSPLANARKKAKAYYECLKRPVFSCDSGLYLWSVKTGEKLPEELQPGIHVRGRDKKRLSDEELIAHYTGLVKKYGLLRARYHNAICFVTDEENAYESMDDSLNGDFFLITDTPHAKRIPGFPLDSISLEIKSGKYYYDLEGNSQDDMAAFDGFRQFFESYIKISSLCDE